VNQLVHNVAVYGTYPILWFFSFLCLLPVGLGGGRHDPDTGAPLNPMLGRKALYATGIAAVLFAVFYVLVTLGVFDL
jgi:predicted secreted protein